jgi:hypothetical protein
VKDVKCEHIRMLRYVVRVLCSVWCVACGAMLDGYLLLRVEC